jgi:hypothetical protein
MRYPVAFDTDDQLTVILLDDVDEAFTPVGVLGEVPLPPDCVVAETVLDSAEYKKPF